MKAREFYEYLYGEKPPKNFTNRSSIHIFGFAEAYAEYLNQRQTLPIDSVVRQSEQFYCKSQTEDSRELKCVHPCGGNKCKFEQ